MKESTLPASPLAREGAPDRPISPLRSGDHLSREEFERRYAAAGDSVRAELIGGVVYVASPTTSTHGDPHFDLVGWLAAYRAATPGTKGSAEATDKLGEEDEPQPDVLLRILPEAGGASRKDAAGYICGGPELVAEVAYTSAAYDLHEKLDTYRRHGCREYLVLVTEPPEVRWFLLEGGTYVPLRPDADGISRSRVFPGLWLDSAAFLRGDLAHVLAVVQRGLASPEHAAFVSEIERRLALARDR